uniref:Ferritin heavy chain 1 n=1 Tax=Cynoglossus semilaevis TaxID=244447 RepID=A0A3P8VAJ1_CYNSE
FTAAISRHINLELYASYVQLSMVSDASDSQHTVWKVRTNPCQTCPCTFKLMSLEGGRIVLQDIKKPDRDEWWNGQEYLLDLHVTATEHNDPHVSKRLRMSFYCKTIESQYLDEQVESIKQLGDLRLIGEDRR